MEGYSMRVLHYEPPRHCCGPHHCEQALLWLDHADVGLLFLESGGDLQLCGLHVGLITYLHRVVGSDPVAHRGRLLLH